MPPPVDPRPARLTVHLQDLIYDWLYAPVALGVTFASERLNTLQFPHHPAISEPRLLRAGLAALGARAMAVILDLAVQGAQMLLVLLLAPLLTGFTRKVKARILSRRGPPLLQPYRDLIRLMRKDACSPRTPRGCSASSPTSCSPRPGSRLRWSDLRDRAHLLLVADMIAIIAFSAPRASFLALAGLDVGTSFGGIGSSREVMIASLAEPRC
jgi:hypothetical protein